jgi:hypothetical protein
MKKVNANRHQQLTTNYRQPSTNNQKPATTADSGNNKQHHQQKHPTNKPNNRQRTRAKMKMLIFLAILTGIGKDCSYLVTEHHFLVSVAHQSFDLFYCIPALKFD